MNIKDIIKNIYNKFFNKKEKQKLLNQEIERRTNKSYKIAKASGKTYKCSDEQLKEIIRKKEARKIMDAKKNKFKRNLVMGVAGITAAATIVGNYNGTAQKNQEKENTTKTIEQGEEIEIPGISTDENGNIIVDVPEKGNKKDESSIENILREYNKKYPDANLKKEDLGVIYQPSIEYLVKEITDDGNVKYIENSWKNWQLKENQNFVSSNINDGYTLIAKNEIIASVARVEGGYSNVDVERISTGKKEYFKSKKYYELDDPSNAKDALNNFYIERKKQIENEGRSR